MPVCVHYAVLFACVHPLAACMFMACEKFHDHRSAFFI